MKAHRIVGLFCFGLAALLIAGIASAGTITYTITHPTQYEDNTALVLADIQQTRIEYGTCVGVAFGTKAGETIITGSGTTKAVTGLAAATYCSRAFTTAKNVESLSSNIMVTVVSQSPPKPPVLAAVATTAYNLLKQRDALVMLPVGTVPLDTPCLADQTANGYYAVPRATVTFTGTVKPEVVFAQCAAT